MGPVACTRGVILLLLLQILVMGEASADCDRPKAPHDMILSDEIYQSHRFPEGTSIRLECEKLHDIVNGTGLAVCTGGEWSEPDLVCTKKNCGVPPPQPHTIFDLGGGTTLGDTIRVSCEQGYELRGMSYRVCYRFGWYGSSSCKVKDCYNPVPSANMIISAPNGTLYGAKLELSCERGYKLIATKIIQCKTRGWSGSAICKKVFCKAPGRLANGTNSWNSTDSPTPGSTIHYRCNKGYVLNGTSAIVCQENEEYDHPPPACQLVACRAPAEPANGKSSWNMEQPRVGQTIQYSCNRGFVLNGSSAIVCQEDGEFDRPPPTCDAVVECRAPGELANGKTSWQTNDSLTFGQAVHYVCNEGFLLNGTNVTVCQEDGGYDHMPPTCCGYEDISKMVADFPSYTAVWKAVLSVMAIGVFGFVAMLVYLYRRKHLYEIRDDHKSDELKASYRSSRTEEPVG